MRALDSEIAYFRIRIAQQFAAQLSSSEPIPEGAIRNEVVNGPFKLPDEELEEIIRELESNFTTSQKRGAAVTSDYKPWLSSRRSAIDFYYWNRLRRYYLEGGILAPQVVATLDAVTDEVLDYLGDPANEGSWSRRGMVMGHVQSGKTTNYSALICKAADAGYKVIILLAGITNSLRSQTQERLDETFIGKKSVFQATAQTALPLLTYATLKRFPAYGTSRDQDFNKRSAGVIFSLEAHSEPMIFITKKNRGPLDSLQSWLKEQAHGDKISAPLLLIDDEADNASINTSKTPAETTAINAGIRRILNLFERSSYVGYTATPFANIFIDPDSDQQMLSDDLFPRNFIKELDPPSTYVGAARVFAEDGELRPAMVRVIDDFAGILPLAHKRDLQPAALPPSLYTAIRIFVLALAMRTLRGQGKKHCSMMINVSRFNDVQERVLGLVYEYLHKLRNSLIVNGAVPPAKSGDPEIIELRKDFEREFKATEFKFADVLKASSDAAATISVVTINMKGGKLDYQQHGQDGLHVIAIGGLALSRGLTLEGLTVSYILRNTAASDTLMQMARWFGYRPGYEDLCRVYLPEGSLDHYAYIHEAIEELRTEVRRMQAIGLTPQHFGLKVRQSPTAIRITAANKMRSASSLTLAQDYSSRHVEGYSLVNDDAVNRRNLELVQSFVRRVGSAGKFEDTTKALIWRDIAGSEVLELFRKFRFADTHPDLGRISADASLLQDYIADRIHADLKTWDVAVPFPAGGEPRSDILSGQSFPLRRRDSGIMDEFGAYRVTRKNRLADPDDARLALSDKQLADAEEEKRREDGLQGDRAYSAQRSKPLLIVHLFTAEKPLGLQIKGPVVSLSVSLPKTEVAARSRQYQVNKVYQKQLQELQPEPEDDDQMLETPPDA
ncbi:endonuclease [Bradyrhizobium ottawaense]|uniref:Z1 domain-containing protein n=1 Tax=Bradyrhizobium TaxID=374 RepID=UPI001260ECBA|nr:MULTISPECIES: Z1 domain-containing protein [Bradyrhizobium]BBO06291.1 endonuclease [Bradyrhizobium ottawaense]BBO12568.1 endonuclease [Bradyrhizobium sp. TM102]